jgi:hypothetical protein
MSLLVYDIETKYLAEQLEGGWVDKAGMRLGVGCVYNYDHDRYNFFMPGQEEQLEGYLRGNRVVSYNGKAFDSYIVQQSNTPDTTLWTDIDVFELIVCAKHSATSIDDALARLGRSTVLNGSLGLDVVCAATLGHGKPAKLGRLAPSMLADGHWADLFGYVLQDVRRLRQLFEHILEKGWVIDGEQNTVQLTFTLEDIG